MSGGLPASRVTAFSAHLPGLARSQRLLGWDPGVACAAEDAQDVLGRKRLRYKSPATRLALCAVARALGVRPGEGGGDETTAVVVSSNLAVLDTVADVARTLHVGDLRDVSPMDAPNVSPNVIASTIAIWFGFRGPCLQLSSGHTAGLDAVGVGQLLLAAGRAERVVVVGAEPAGAAATALMAGGGQPLRPAAACAVLQRPGPVPGGGLLVGPVTSVSSAAPGVRVPGAAGAPPVVVDLTVQVGQVYAALGVLLVTAAAGALSHGTVCGPLELACGSDDDGWRTTTLSWSLP